jgi:hypothetical protein
VEESARLFSIHRNTVRAWLKASLQAIDGSRPTLILGSELRRFHNQRRAKSRCLTPAGMIYCLRCREPRQPAGNIVDYLPRTTRNGDIQCICSVCDAMLYRRVNLGIGGGSRWNGSIREADPRKSQREEPSLNHDFATEPFVHADTQS